jgi:UTP--glucose-1-phosphate uridylyltransferase
MSSPATSPQPEPTPPDAGNAPSVRRPAVAVVPAAGFGSRLRPLTDITPKEMLPVGRRVALERIVDELRAAGMVRIVFVLSPAKEPLIRGHFGEGAPGTSFDYVIQPEMRGLGDAVLRAEPHVRVGEPFVVALGDAVFEEPKEGSVTTRLADAFAASPDQAALGLVVQQVPRERLSRYGVVRPAGAASAEPFPISDIVEKPTPAKAPSDYAAAARYILTTDIFDILRATRPGQNGEIQLTDAMRAILAQGRTGVAVPLKPGEVRHDIGGLDSYFKAFAAFALTDPEQGDGLRAYLEERLALPPSRVGKDHAA